MTKPTPPPARWYRQPILWLGMVLFVASLAGCVWLIVVAQRHVDPAVPTAEALFKVPVTAAGEDSPDER